MAKPQPAPDASIEEMLGTIREAINEESARGDAAPGLSNAVSGTMREMRVSLQPGSSGKQGTISTREDDFLTRRPAPVVSPATTRVTGAPKQFSGIMGGDVRLEEALSRMQHAERRQVPNQPPIVPRPQATVAPATQQPAENHPQNHISRRAESYSLNPDTQIQQDPFGRVEQPIVAPQPQRTPAASSFGTDAPLNRDNNRFVHAGQSAQPAIPVGIETPAAPLPVTQAMLADETSKAAADAFSRLSDELLMRSVGGDEKLAGTVREMVRPMLKSWLDDKLPELVERLVREEIERVVRRGGH